MSKIIIHLRRPSNDPISNTMYWCGAPVPTQSYAAIGETCEACNQARFRTLMEITDKNTNES